MRFSYPAIARLLTDKIINSVAHISTVGIAGNFLIKHIKYRYVLSERIKS